MIFKIFRLILHKIYILKYLKKMKKAILISLSIFLSSFIFAQVNPITPDSGVKWHSIEEAEKLFQKSPRPIFIDTYTDWCGWCKKMDKETFTNAVIADLLNKNFYPVKFDAEGKEKVTFMGQTFINDGKAGKTHQFAMALLQGQMSYPTVVFMTKEDEKFSVSPVPGFREPKDMEVLLSFFSGNAYKTQKWDDFQKNFIGKVQ